MQETWVQSLGQEGLLEKGTVTHFSVLAWRIPWTEEPGGLHSMVLQRVVNDWMTNPHFFLVRWLKQVYCLSIPSASARRQLRESEPVWSSPSDAQTLLWLKLGDCGRGLFGVRSFFALQGAVFCLAVHKQFYGGILVPGRRERIVVWGQS